MVILLSWPSSSRKFRGRPFFEEGECIRILLVVRGYMCRPYTETNTTKTTRKHAWSRFLYLFSLILPISTWVREFERKSFSRTCSYIASLKTIILGKQEPCMQPKGVVTPNSRALSSYFPTLSTISRFFIVCWTCRMCKMNDVLVLKCFRYYTLFAYSKLLRCTCPSLAWADDVLNYLPRVPTVHKTQRYHKRRCLVVVR